MGYTSTYKPRQDLVKVGLEDSTPNPLSTPKPNNKATCINEAAPPTESLKTPTKPKLAQSSKHKRQKQRTKQQSK